MNTINEKNSESPVQVQEKSSGGKRFTAFVNAVFYFVLITCIIIGIAGLGFEYILVKGPSPALRDRFVMTMLETRRFAFISNIFLSEEEVAEIQSRHRISTEIHTDTTLINITDEDGSGDVTTEDLNALYGLTDDDGDGVIVDEFKYQGSSCYMMIVLDPSRVFVGKPDRFGEYGETVGEMCEKYGAIGGINAGGFFDDNGGGLGSTPAGLTVADGTFYNTDAGYDCFVGFDYDNILHVGYMDYGDACDANIRDGVSFGPVLVSNGEAVSSDLLASGINPRTAIGQRADGAVLLLVVDGRQAHSLGASYEQLAQIMLNYGAINACNLDGGSSSVIWYKGDYINRCSAANGKARDLPTGFIVGGAA